MKKILFNILLLFPLCCFSQTDELIFTPEIIHEKEPEVVIKKLEQPKGGDFVSMVIRDEMNKRSLSGYSNVKHSDIYSENEDGTYTAKYDSYDVSGGNQEEYFTEKEAKENNLEATEIQEDIYTYRDGDYSLSKNKSSMDEETVLIFIKIGFVILMLLIAELFGRAKHIGKWWSFFLLLSGLLPGIIATISSPSAKKSPTQAGKSYLIWAVICFILGVLNMITFFRDKGENGYLFYVFLIISVYLYKLSKGQIINKKPKFYFDTKPKVANKPKSNSINTFVNTSIDKTTIKNKFELLIKATLDEYTREQIIFIQKEGFDVDNPMFGVILQNNLANWKKDADENFLYVGYKLDLTMIEIKEIINKVFQNLLEECFES